MSYQIAVLDEQGVEIDRSPKIPFGVTPYQALASTVSMVATQLLVSGYDYDGLAESLIVLAQRVLTESLSEITHPRLPGGTTYRVVEFDAAAPTPVFDEIKAYHSAETVLQNYLDGSQN